MDHFDDAEGAMTNYQQAQNALRELSRVNVHTALPWVVALAARAIGHAALELAAALRSAKKGGPS